MRGPLVLLVLGIAVVVGAVVGDLRSRALQLGRAEDIRLLRVELDSTRRALAVATTAADSARLTTSVAERTRLLGSRMVHASGGPSSTGNRWSLSGPSAVFGTAGVAILALAIALIVRDARARK
jgi:hypothetical protein